MGATLAAAGHRRLKADRLPVRSDRESKRPEKAATALFFAQRDERIEASDPASGGPAGEQPCRGDERGHGPERERIGGGDLEEERGEQLGAGDSSPQTASDAEERAGSAPTNQLVEQAVAPGAQRESDADLAGAQLNRAGYQAVDANERQQRRRAGEGAEQIQRESVGGDASVRRGSACGIRA